MKTMETYAVSFGNVTRHVPVHEPMPGVHIPLVSFLGDVELTQVFAEQLAKHVPAETQMLVTVETSPIPLAHVIASMVGLPYLVVRKHRRSYMERPLIQEVESFMLGKKDVLWLDSRVAEKMLNQKLTLVTDVVASGGTMTAMERLVRRAGGEIVGRLAAFRQGEPETEVFALAELPVL